MHLLGSSGVGGIGEEVRGQLVSLFSAPTVWVLRIKLMSWGLVGKTLSTLTGKKMTNFSNN